MQPLLSASKAGVMADGTSMKIDTAGFGVLLEKLSGPLRESLARSMAVAGGEVVRDEAKMRAPQGPTGKLAAAIYLAFRDRYSNDKQVQYSVTWNSSKAPHGHLVEFGYWQIYPVMLLDDGTWITNPKVRLKHPKWVAAHPFLRPAYEASIGRAMQAMLDRARQRLPELLRESAGSISALPMRSRGIPGAAINLRRS